MVVDWYYEKMRSLAESHGVTFEARASIDDNELVDILNRATAMVYPRAWSRSGSRLWRRMLAAYLW